MALKLGTGSASVNVSAVKVGTGSSNVNATKVMVGTGSDCVQVWPVFVPMGMNKSGTLDINRVTWTKITGWVARSGYPDTSIVNSELSVTSSGNATFTVSVTFGTGGSSGETRGYRIVQNGSVVVTNTTTATLQTVSGTHNIALTAGDLIRLEAYNASFLTAVRRIQTSTYIYFNAA